jgi:ankyrin repeat protein
MAMFGRADNITRWCERFPTWDLSRRDRTLGGTALGFAITFGPNKLEAVKALVKAGANPLAFTGLAGTTCLHSAAGNKDTDAELVRYLLELPGVRALINTPMRARTLRWKAKLLVVRLLVKLGSTKAVVLSVNEWSKRTPLITAARSGNAAVMRVLVKEGGADTQLQNSRGHTALDLLVGGENALAETRMLLGGGV